MFVLPHGSGWSNTKERRWKAKFVALLPSAADLGAADFSPTRVQQRIIILSLSLRRIDPPASVLSVRRLALYLRFAFLPVPQLRLREKNQHPGIKSIRIG